MPKVKRIVTYSCEICGAEYTSREGAVECEKLGVAIPEYMPLRVVELVGFSGEQELTTLSGYKLKAENGAMGIVDEYEYDGDRYDPHKLPAYYLIRLAAQNGQGKRDAVISREHLRAWVIKKDAPCPLCSGETVPTTHSYLELTWNLPLNMRGVAPARECSNCGVKFLTTRQSREVEAIIKKKMKRPLANRARLIKNEEFQY